MPRNQRRMRNYLIRPVSQLKLSGFVAVVMVAIVVGLNVINYLKYSNITRVMSNFYGLNEETREILLGIRMQLFLTDLMSTIVISLVIILIWIKMTHRIYGAGFAIEKFVSLMIEGKYESKLTLRKKDEFKNVADVLNELGSVLQKRYAQTTKGLK